MATENLSDVDKVLAVVPTVPRERVALTLEAFNGNVDNAVLHLLSEQQTTENQQFTDVFLPEDPPEPAPSPPSVTTSAPTSANTAPTSNIVYETGDAEQDALRAAQMREDENLAKMLQEEERRQNVSTMRRGRPATETDRNAQSVNMDEVAEKFQEGLQTAYTKAKILGSAAANKFNELYKSYMEEEPRTAGQASRAQLSSHNSDPPAHDNEASVVNSSDYETGSNLRQRNTGHQE